MMRVVYVEDNPANVFLVKRVAKKGNHKIINYNDGEQAIRNLDKDKPDLILMDIQLAGELTGVEAIKKIRKQGVTTPIIALTAYAMSGDREKCLKAGSNDYLSKPVPIPDLVRIFDTYAPKDNEPKSEKIDDAATQPTATSTDKIVKPIIPSAEISTLEAEQSPKNA